MKTPIEVKDIRAGDLIRWEAAHESAPMVATEYRASEGGEGFKIKGRHYLLDRPVPPVELPTEPTLGWLRWDGIKGTRKRLAVWHLRESDDPYVHPPRRLQLFADGLQVSPETVESFEPVVVLPLRDLHRLADGMKSVSNESRRRSFDSNEGLRRVFEDARTLLAAVDTANGDAS